MTRRDAVPLAGPPPESARSALILLHGRGGSPADVAFLAPHLADGATAVFAPAALGGFWYPARFIAPRRDNAEALAASLGQLDALLATIVASGLRHDRVAFAGFSQGACLALEFVARRQGRWAGVAAFAGGLIGPADEPLDHAGDLAGTPVYLGCGVPDFHIPEERVRESASVLGHMGARVTLDLIPGHPHAVSSAMVRAARLALAG